MRDFWAPTRAFWADDSDANREVMRSFMTLGGTRFQYLTGVSDPERIDPSAWLYDQLFLDRPGSVDIQLEIIRDYRSNVALYPRFHDYFRRFQPRTLILWGRNDPIFAVEGAHAFIRDLPSAELHLLDTGHFALEDKADEMIPLIRDFLAEHCAPRAFQPHSARSIQ